MTNLEVIRLSAYAVSLGFLSFVSVIWTSKDFLNWLIKFIILASLMIGAVNFYSALSGIFHPNGWRTYTEILSAIISLGFLFSTSTGTYAIAIKFFSLISLMSTILYFTL